MGFRCPGLVFHVNSHTFRKQKVFENAEYERLIKESFFRTAARWGFELLECEVMPSHVHWLLRFDGSKLSLPKAMNLLKGRASRELLARFPELKIDLRGHLWDMGYYDRRIRTKAQFDGTIRYIREQKQRGGLQG